MFELHVVKMLPVQFTSMIRLSMCKSAVINDSRPFTVCPLIAVVKKADRTGCSNIPF